MIDQTEGYEVDGVPPSSIALPDTVDELGDVLARASAQGLAVAPWGGGTRVAIGNPPERMDIVVDVSRINQVLAYNSADLTVTVGAGMTFTALRQALSEHDQFLAIDPPLPDRATVGGTLACGVAGPMTWQLWSPRDLTIGMKVVLANGRFSSSGGQVVKNVSGYDMARLHIGGMGTLGLIAEASFKLTPLPVKQATVVAVFDTGLKCHQAAVGVLASGVLPLAMTALNPASASLAGLDEADGSYALAVRLGGRPRTLDRQVEETKRACADLEPSRLDVLEQDEAAGLWEGVRDFGWSEETRPLLGCRASVLPSQVGSLVANLEHIVTADGTAPALISYPAYGTVLAGWYGDGSAPSDDLLADTVSKARRAAREAGGNIMVEQCPTPLKHQINVWDEVGDSIAIMRRMKQQYDPDRILNPGRFAGGI